MMKCYSKRGLWLAALTVFLAACSDSPVAIEQGGDMANGTAPTLEIWWPSNGANVTGVQPFKARLGSWGLGGYHMYWQVDGGQLNRMGDSYVDGPHKESAVNVSAFTWSGAGPYRITFVARDMRGATIAQRSVDISVGTNATTPPPPPPPPPTPSATGNIFASARLWIDP